MTPGARIQAAIDCLESILPGAPAEKVLTNWARRSRFAGSKDRAAVRDHVFDALRRRDSYAVRGGAVLPVRRDDPRLARQIMLGLALSQDLDVAALFTGSGHSPAALTQDEIAVTNTPAAAQESVWNMPDWCASQLDLQYGPAAAEIAELLCQRAPVDVRVNLSKSTLAQAVDVLEAEDIEAEPCSIASTALRVITGARRIKMSRAFNEGLIELQDAGSQALIDAMIASGALTDERRVLDYCAGGGGKSLAMAGQVRAAYFAHDVSAARMGDIPARAKRAGSKITCLSPQDLSNLPPFNLVLCDAPCSGSGAWRRNPAAKWTFSRTDLNDVLDVQKAVLDKAHRLVAPGGYLAYATCSLFAEENEDQVKAFLAAAPGFVQIFEKSWTLRDGSDGFFLSVMEKS